MKLLKKAFEKPVRHQDGAVVCRFCKGPLFLGGDFCEHCGAPVAEAAPPGLVPPNHSNRNHRVSLKMMIPWRRSSNPRSPIRPRLP